MCVCVCVCVCVTVAQELNEDADVQRLKQRRQNLMYQVAVLQLQQVRNSSRAAASRRPNFIHRDNQQGKMTAMLQTR